MKGLYDTVVAGGGLAGSSSARALSIAGQKVCLVDKELFASGASGSGLALVSPMMSRKGRPVWNVREALDILGYEDTGLLRPANSLEQAAYFEESSLQNPDLGTWIGPGEAAKTFPYLLAPFGLVLAHRGYAIDLATTTKSWIVEAVNSGCDAVENVSVVSWIERRDQVVVFLSDGDEISANRLLLTMGPELAEHPETRDLNLHPIKGQRIRLKKPPGWYPSIMPISGAGFILDEGETLSIGATFEHEWKESGPTAAGRLELLDQAAEMIPEIRQMEVVEHISGIRVTVPGTRMPMLGLLPNHIRTWVFTGLGSKGVLMAALFGTKIPDFFNDITKIPSFCRVALRTAKV